MKIESRLKPNLPRRRRPSKEEEVARLLKKVASGRELQPVERWWIKHYVVEDVLGEFVHLGMVANYDEMTAKWADMPTHGDFDSEAYEDLLTLALNYYEELKDDYYSSRN